MEDNFNTMMREALKRRAERVEPLKAMSRPLSISPRGGEGRGSRRWWLAVPAIAAAAAIVIGVLLWLHGTKDVAIEEQPQVAETETPAPVPHQEEAVVTSTPITAEAATPTPVPPRGEGVITTTSTPLPRQAKVSAPSLAGRAGGESESGPSVAELYATIDAMTDQALREAERLTIETLSRNVAAEQPS